MTDRELMQQALEALEAMQSYAAAERKGLRICDEAIYALRQALAEPEQNPFGDDAERYARKLHEEREAYKAIFTERKPQTTHWEGCEAVHPECRKPEQEPDGISWLKRDNGYFTAPTPRQWVSLTEQEMYDLFFHDQYGPRLPEYLVNTIKCVEAALKEKNNGS